MTHPRDPAPSPLSAPDESAAGESARDASAPDESGAPASPPPPTPPGAAGVGPSDPAWHNPSSWDRYGDRARETGEGLTLLWGAILVVVGVWFLLEQTFEIDLPSVPWDDLWPVLIIAIGGWIILRGFARRRS